MVQVLELFALIRMVVEYECCSVFTIETSIIESLATCAGFEVGSILWLTRVSDLGVTYAL